MTVFKRLYGDHVLHLIVLVAALALGAYTISVLGVDQLFNPRVWWQSIAVWFAVAVIGHDLILFPLYALAERLLPKGRRRADPDNTRRVPIVNYLRMPTLASALTFAMFLPGIIEQGAFTYNAATGLTQEPYLARWLLLVAGFYLLSAVCYLVRSVMTRTRPAHPATR
ncbi:hypothetical protein CIW49_03560 [Mycolicibacterium sp. P1-18]|uniref:hypothetical protein n=1 Tax=Mycolicibacterium sp. P1-18 TaxID=2024615 RepID=UPI0011F0DF99|nr:hypothetical protein [Mycolicibacterium sp. P1-18]KAA0102395.1 hypothetical protein CIW49_03560 [Mycolicibacterium sp. P1-18]